MINATRLRLIQTIDGPLYEVWDGNAWITVGIDQAGRYLGGLDGYVDPNDAIAVPEDDKPTKD